MIGCCEMSVPRGSWPIGKPGSSVGSVLVARALSLGCVNSSKNRGRFGLQERSLMINEFLIEIRKSNRSMYRLECCSDFFIVFTKVCKNVGCEIIIVNRFLSQCQFIRNGFHLIEIFSYGSGAFVGGG